MMAIRDRDHKTNRDIGRDPPLQTGGERELGHPGDLGDVREEHDQEPGLLYVFKLRTHESKHDQARNHSNYNLIRQQNSHNYGLN